MKILLEQENRPDGVWWHVFLMSKKDKVMRRVTWISSFDVANCVIHDFQEYVTKRFGHPVSVTYPTSED